MFSHLRGLAGHTSEADVGGIALEKRAVRRVAPEGASRRALEPTCSKRPAQSDLLKATATQKSAKNELLGTGEWAHSNKGQQCELKAAIIRPTFASLFTLCVWRAVLT